MYVKVRKIADVTYTEEELTAHKQMMEYYAKYAEEITPAQQSLIEAFGIVTGPDESPAERAIRQSEERRAASSQGGPKGQVRMATEEGAPPRRRPSADDTDGNGDL